MFLFLTGMTVTTTHANASSWYNSSWTERAPITINNKNTNNLVYYQVKIDVMYDPAMKVDFSDLRFTRDDGVTLLQYWIEDYTVSASAEVWVKVPSVPGSGATTIYMYYGNPAATSASNIQKTFIFGDDFNDGSLDTSRWTENCGAYNYPSTDLPGGCVSETGGELYVRTELEDLQWLVQTRYIVSTAHFNTRGTAFDYKLRIVLNEHSHRTGLWIMDRYLAPDPDGMLDPPPEEGRSMLSMTFEGESEPSEDYLDVFKEVNLAESAPYFGPWTYGEEYVPLSIRLTDSEMAFVANGVEVYRGANDLDFESGYLYANSAGRGFYGSPLLNEAYFDDIRVRKYVEPEPTASIGEEEGLVSYWKFDEGARTTAYDSVDGNNGTVQGASWTTGRVSKALSFDGTDDYVLVPDSPNLCPTEAITLEAWIKPREMESWFSKHIVAKADPDYLDPDIPNSAYEFLVRNYEGYQLEFSARFEGVPTGYRTDTGPLAVNTWNHVVATYDGSFVRIYVNGTCVLEQAQTGRIVYSTFPNMPLQIGASISTRPGYDSVCYFNGLIDEVAIYGRALTGQEILKHYQNGLTGSGYCKFPYIKSFTVTPDAFSPNADGRKDTANMAASFSTTVNWQLQVRTLTDTTVRLWTGTGSTFNINWDGKDGGGIPLPDGDYELSLSGTNTANAPFATKCKNVTIDTALPIVNVSVYHPPFNPSLGQNTRIDYTLFEASYVTIKIYKSSNLCRTLLNSVLQPACFNSIMWDGKDDVGSIVTPGTYTIKIWIEDGAGNRATTYPVSLTATIVA